MQNEFYVEYKTFPTCKNCNSKIYIENMNLTLITKCKCIKDTKERKEHISDLYNKMQFTKELKRVKIGESLEYYNKLRSFVPKALLIMRKIIIIYFNYFSVFFPFLKNDDDFEGIQNELQFFDEKNAEKFKENVLNLNNENLSEKNNACLKRLMMDIYFFILFLKKCPYYIETLEKKFNGIEFFELNDNNDNTFKFYDEFQEVIKSVFCPHYEECIKVIKVYVIPETNTILLFTLEDIIFYNFELNEISFILRQGMAKADIYKINSKKLLFHIKGDLCFIYIKYDSMNRPIKIYNKYLKIKQIKYISSVNVIDDNNIVVIDSSENLYLLKKDRDGNYFIDKQKKIICSPFISHNNTYTSFLYTDKSNERIILYLGTEKEYYDYIDNESRVTLCFYDIYFEEIKELTFQINNKTFCSNQDFHILNNETYILFFGQKIYLISSKNLEIVSIYDNINLPNHRENILILNQTKNIFIFPCIKNYYANHFKFVENEIKYIGGKIYSKDFIDIKEINDDGDSIIFTNTKAGPIFYYFKNDTNISEYNFFAFKTTKKTFINYCDHKHLYYDSFLNDLRNDFLGCTCGSCCPRLGSISEVLDYIELNKEDYYKYKKKKRRIKKRKKKLKTKKNIKKKYMIKYGEEDEYDIDFFQNKNIIKTFF